MKQKKEKTIINIIAFVTLGILLVTWWANGQDDTWLYVVSALMVTTLFFPFFYSNRK